MVVLIKNQQYKSLIPPAIKEITRQYNEEVLKLDSSMEHITIHHDHDK
jgi:hypothetical protein